MEKIKIKKETAFLFNGKKNVSKKMMMETTTNTSGSSNSTIVFYP